MLRMCLTTKDKGIPDPFRMSLRKCTDLKQLQNGWGVVCLSYEFTKKGVL